MLIRNKMVTRILLGFFVLATLSVSFSDAISTLTGQPHIIFILADDMGWNDVGFHGSSQIPTPNIDALCYNGIILNSYYSQPTCTPSRTALMTGKYPIRLGMQGVPLSNVEARGVPLSEKLLPEYLRELGYSTKAVGKWHLGMSRTSQLPTSRGFDSHFGYRGGFIGYYDYILQQNYKDEILYGFDMYRNLTPTWDDVGTYATDLFTNEAVNVIREHDNRTPLFLYLSHLAVHAGNEGSLVEAPPETVVKMGHIVNPNRRKYAAMVNKLDESVGRVVRALEERNMLDNSIIIFASDNGSPTFGEYENFGSNYPFRGIKYTMWEGGIHVPACIWSRSFSDTPRVSNEMFHITDWLPTLVTAANGFSASLPYPTDGMDQWISLLDNRRSARLEILHNIDEKERVAAYRRGSWKLMLGQYREGDFDDFYGDDGTYNIHYVPYDYNEVFTSETSKAIGTILRPTTPSEMSILRERATVNCPKDISSPCDFKTSKFCLFDLDADPCEQRDLSKVYPHIVRQIKQTLAYYKSYLVGQPAIVEDPAADPARYNYTWTPWLDY